MITDALYATTTWQSCINKGKPYPMCSKWLFGIPLHYILHLMSRTAFPPAHFQSDGKLYAEPTSLLTAQLNGMLAVSIIFLALSWICVALRVYVRAGLIKAFGLDDWCMVGTLVCVYRKNVESNFIVLLTRYQILFSVFACILCAMSEWLLEDVAAYAEGQNPAGDMIPQVSWRLLEMISL